MRLLDNSSEDMESRIIDSMTLQHELILKIETIVACLITLAFFEKW